MSSTEKTCRYSTIQIFLCIMTVIILLILFQDYTETTEIYEKITIETNMQDINIKAVKASDVKPKTKNRKNIKYILQWTSPNAVPFIFMGQGKSVFIEEKCRFQDCFITSDREYLGDYTEFDVIIFHAPEILKMGNHELPSMRESHQKYAFVSIESSDYYPICSDRFNRYFNWVWTYRLGSDSEWTYIVVRDKKGKVIGPKKEMHWMKLEQMKPVKPKLRKKLKRKTKFAVWYVSNCNSISKREVFINDLNKELRERKTGYQVDIIGECGKKICERTNWTYCDKIIERDYFFYMAFENSFSEDYVTEKVLHALKYNSIPVVYGGANYTRFMPDGIYLNARELGVKKLAKKMVEIRMNFKKYVEYFRWTNHYSFQSRNFRSDTNYFCHICKLLNNEGKMKDTSVHENLKEWWDPPNKC